MLAELNLHYTSAKDKPEKSEHEIRLSGVYVVLEVTVATDAKHWHRGYAHWVWSKSGRSQAGV